jgi:hypothetical protein
VYLAADVRHLQRSFSFNVPSGLTEHAVNPFSEQDKPPQQCLVVASWPEFRRALPARFCRKCRPHHDGPRNPELACSGAQFLRYTLKRTWRGRSSRSRSPSPTGRRSPTMVPISAKPTGAGVPSIRKMIVPTGIVPG